MSTTASMMDTEATEPEGVKWLWEADREEQIYDAASRHGTRMAACAVTLNSVKPLSQQLVEQAATHLHRKAPNLRSCVYPRDGHLWICQPHQSQVDFKVLSNDTDLSEEVNLLCQQGFPYSDKTHWRARLIPRNKETTSCTLPQVKDTFPYQYDFIIFGHHAVSDGINVVLYVQGLLDILNDILSDRIVDDNEQYGKYVKESEIKEIKLRIRESLEKNPNQMDAVKKTLPPPNKSLLLLKAFPPPEGIRAATKHVKRMVAPQVLNNFKAKSKEHGVTFNSSFVAAINTAITELLQEAGVLQESYQLSVNHLINLRRYMKPSPKLLLGTHSDCLSHTVIVDKNVRNRFWEHCQSINQELQANLKSGAVLVQKVFREIQEEEVPPVNYFINPCPPIHDYSVTNLGDLSTIISGVGDHVQITDIIMYSIIHNFIHMNLHHILTFRGHTSYCISYATDYLSDETANMLADKVLSVLSYFSVSSRM